MLEIWIPFRGDYCARDGVKCGGCTECVETLITYSEPWFIHLFRKTQIKLPHMAVVSFKHTIIGK